MALTGVDLTDWSLRQKDANHSLYLYLTPFIRNVDEMIDAFTPN